MCREGVMTFSKGVLNFMMIVGRKYLDFITIMGGRLED